MAGTRAGELCAADHRLAERVNSLQLSASCVYAGSVTNMIAMSAAMAPPKAMPGDVQSLHRRQLIARFAAHGLSFQGALQRGHGFVPGGAKRRAAHRPEWSELSVARSGAIVGAGGKLTPVRRLKMHPCRA